MARKRYDDDDGRTIADMSGVSAPSLFGHLPKRKAAPEQELPDIPSAEPEISKEERRWYIRGALKAALLIGFAFIAGLTLVVLLLMAIWGIL